MQENIKKFIKELSEQYDKDSQDTYISLYLNKTHYKKFLEHRIKTCKSILKGQNLTNFNKTINQIENTLKDFSKDSIAIFGSFKNDYLKFLKLSIELKNELIVDSSPYIRPLARILDEWESFTLVLVNSNYATIFSVSIGKINEVKKMKPDMINKHKKGGWSQARFNRIRRGAIDKFLSEVVEALEKKTDENIVISGPGTIKNRFIEMLPKDLQKRVLDVIDISIEDEKKLLKESFRLVSEKEEEQSSDAVKQLKQEILKDGLAVYGLNETLAAAKMLKKCSIRPRPLKITLCFQI